MWTKAVGKGLHLIQQGLLIFNTNGNQGGMVQWPSNLAAKAQGYTYRTIWPPTSGSSLERLVACINVPWLLSCPGQVEIRHIIADRDRNHSEYPSSPQERGGPCYISIHNGKNTQYKARHSVSVQGMKATKTKEQKPSGGGGGNGQCWLEGRGRWVSHGRYST